MLALIQRAGRDAESDTLDPAILSELREALRTVTPDVTDWATLSLTDLRAATIGERGGNVVCSENEIALRAALACYSALCKLCGRAAREAVLAIAEKLRLSEKLCLALLEGNSREPTRSGARRERARQNAEVELRDAALPFLRWKNAAEPWARVLYFLYRESRQALLSIVSKDERRLNELVNGVLEASERFGVHLPPLVRSEPAAWLWRFECVVGMYELPTVTVLRLLASEIEWMLDGGAHIGCLSLAMKSFNADCDVVAIEPYPLVREVAKRNLAFPRVELITAALTDKSGRCELFPGDGHSNSSLIPGATSSDAAPVQVPAVTIDEVLGEDRFRRPGVIKLDIEGYELEALRGARRFLQACDRSVLVVENNPRLLKKKGQDAGAVHDYLASFGFVGRLILDTFALSRSGVIDRVRTRNYVFAKATFWDDLHARLHG